MARANSTIAFFRLHWLLATLWILSAFGNSNSGAPLPSKEKIVIDTLRSKICYSATYKCTEFSEDLCVKFGSDKCRVMGTFTHSLNVLRFGKESPYYRGTKAYFFCMFEPQNGQSYSCWESDKNDSFTPPDASYCESFPKWCKGRAPKWQKGPIVEKKGERFGNQTPWWDDPYKNVGAVLSACDEFNRFENI